MHDEGPLVPVALAGPVWRVDHVPVGQVVCEFHFISDRSDSLVFGLNVGETECQEALVTTFYFRPILRSTSHSVYQMTARVWQRFRDYVNRHPSASLSVGISVLW